MIVVGICGRLCTKDKSYCGALKGVGGTTVLCVSTALAKPVCRLSLKMVAQGILRHADSDLLGQGRHARTLPVPLAQQLQEG